jgi:putative nucleotidyltransferase with HDIG domain
MNTYIGEINVLSLENNNLNKMKDWQKAAVTDFNAYVDTFSGLTPEQQNNFTIKKEHSLRVAANARHLATTLNFSEEDVKIAVLAAVFHDIGRFRQIAEYSTLNDSVSMDHAELAVAIMKEKQFLANTDEEDKELIYSVILAHNKLEIPRNLNNRELMHARLLRDADKLDILKVLTDYYQNKNQPANNMLTWDLPKSSKVSAGVVKEVLAGKLVTKKEVLSETDVKIMQLSWIYDFNYKPAVEMVLRNRYHEKIYNSLPKNDQIFEIYRKIKVFAENKMME